jgi:hypothetical protein
MTDSLTQTPSPLPCIQRGRAPSPKEGANCMQPRPGRSSRSPSYSTLCNCMTGSFAHRLKAWLGFKSDRWARDAARPSPARFAGQLRRVPPVPWCAPPPIKPAVPVSAAAAAGPVFRWGQAEPPTRARPARSRTPVRVRTHLPQRRHEPEPRGGEASTRSRARGRGGPPLLPRRAAWARPSPTGVGSMHGDVVGRGRA